MLGESGFQSLEVFVVLPQLALEFVAVLVELLRPLGLLFAAEDPAAHVLGLQHEDAVAGEEDVVDLGGAVRGIQGDVVQALVGLPAELQVGEEPDEEFADIAFAEGGFEQADEDHQRDEPGEGGPDLGDERCEVHFRHSCVVSGRIVAKKTVLALWNCVPAGGSFGGGGLGPETQKPRNARLFVWWAHTDSNRGPKDYESSALTD